MTKDHLRSDGLPFADACTKHGYTFGGRTGRSVCPGCQAAGVEAAPVQTTGIVSADCAQGEDFSGLSIVDPPTETDPRLLPEPPRHWQSHEAWDVREAQETPYEIPAPSWRPFLWTWAAILLCVAGVVGGVLIWGMR